MGILCRNLRDINNSSQQVILVIIPEYFVYGWLILLGLGAIGVRLLYPLFRALDFAQWFLKEGDRHPLRAVGMVAGVLVFVGIAGWKLLTTIV